VAGGEVDPVVSRGSMFVWDLSSVELERDGTLLGFEGPTTFRFRPTRSGPVQLILFPIKVCALACGTCLGALMIPATLPLPIICLEMSDGFRVILRQASEYGGTTDRYLRRSLGML